jgi:hypothetical protein
MLHNSIKSDSPSMRPFNLILYLNSNEKLRNDNNVRAAYLVTTSWHLSVVDTCPLIATVQFSPPMPYNMTQKPFLSPLTMNTSWLMTLLK